MRVSSSDARTQQAHFFSLVIKRCKIIHSIKYPTKVGITKKKLKAYNAKPTSLCPLGAVNTIQCSHMSNARRQADIPTNTLSARGRRTRTMPTAFVSTTYFKLNRSVSPKAELSGSSVGILAKNTHATRQNIPSRPSNSSQRFRGTSSHFSIFY